MTTMVDSKIGKTFQRSVGRAKEKLLQNLGKVDRTADEILDEQIGNFNKQQGAATRLQKELNNYIRCIRACAAASRGLLESVGEVYEPEWGGKELLSVNAQSVELLWNDFAHRLAEQVLIPLNTYQAQFPEMRKKIDKRSRKLIDFDGERHALQALQANPRRAEAKLAKQRESLEAAKRTYEVLNMELHEELPSLFMSRIVFLVSAMSTLFASENIFHTETSKVFTELEGIVDRLSKESAKGNLNFKVPTNAIMNHTGGADSPKDEKGGNTSPDKTSNNTNSNHSSPMSSSRPTSLNMNTPCSTSSLHQNGEEHSIITSTFNKMAVGNNHVTTSNGTTTPTESPTSITIPTNHINGSMNGIVESNKTEIVEVETGGSSKMVNGGSDGESSNNNAPVTKEPIMKSSSSPPPTPVNDVTPAESGVLYRVRATYRYQKEDVDELSFEAGEIVRVIEYEEPEEQEEGWLMGIKENGEKGLFPANFTRPI